MLLLTENMAIGEASTKRLTYEQSKIKKAKDRELKSRKFEDQKLKNKTKKP